MTRVSRRPRAASKAPPRARGKAAATKPLVSFFDRLFFRSFDPKLPVSRSVSPKVQRVAVQFHGCGVAYAKSPAVRRARA